MLLKKLYVRFYKSFNYDYLKKSSGNPRSDKDWEWVDEEKELWYPYIEIPIDPKITTVVGANESGKSHLLSAIEKGITGQLTKGEKIVFEDFCRYSDFFTVTKGEFKYPDFGFEWKLEPGKDSQKLNKLKNILSIQSDLNIESFLMFRNNCEKIILYVHDTRYEVEPGKKEELLNLLPKILPIESKISLPNSVPIQAIIDIDKRNKPDNHSWLNLDLGKWQSVNNSLETICKEKEIPCDEKHQTGGYWHDQDGGHRKAENLEKVYLSITPEYGEEIKTRNLLRETLRNNTISEEKLKQFKLAHKLICKVAKIDSDFLAEIIKHSFDDSKQGYVSAIIDRINKNLSEGLNFPSWWVQDKEFKLVVSVSNYHLKFAIKDKTGTSYSFSERSQGLQYFLSYYIQYKSHNPEPANKQEILLMDEPDAFLSSQAQQDLMKIFKAFAEGKDQRQPVQVIYVTHSPFLIDKNHPERIRVLEKGTEEQGTRVVQDIARNHYEPLRSSVGSLVAETAYIGNCNLIVPRLSDQVLIAGLATYLNHLGSSEDTLDLNHITIVPAGDSLQIPFLIRLLRKGIDKPAMIVFLNNDDNGKRIRDLILQQEQVKHSSLKKDFILQIHELNKKEEEQESLINIENRYLIELEDLIPLDLAIEAIRYYQQETFNLDIGHLLNVDKIKSNWNADLSLYLNLENYLESSESNIILDRLGFTKSMIDVLKNNQTSDSKAKEDLIHNFKILFRKLNNLKRNSELDFSQEKISEKVKRFIKSFIMDNPKNASKTQIEQLFKTIENVLDTSAEADETRKKISKLRRDYHTENDPLSKIENGKYSDFIRTLEEVHFTPKLLSQEIPENNRDESKGNKSNSIDNPVKGFNPETPKRTRSPRDSLK
jgi:predicted ATPase